jgi:hypothetical protein
MVIFLRFWCDSVEVVEEVYGSNGGVSAKWDLLLWVEDS